MPEHPKGREHWLGLEIGHRELFQAAQSGWLPAEPLSGRELVFGGFVPACERGRLADNEIPVRLYINPRDIWHQPGVPSGVNLGEGHSLWYSPLPLSAVMRLAVPTGNQTAHLNTMPMSFSNVALPVNIDDAPDWEDLTAPSMRPDDARAWASSAGRGFKAPGSWDFPLAFDRLRGAMTAAACTGGWSGLMPESFQSALRAAWLEPEGAVPLATGHAKLPWSGDHPAQWDAPANDGEAALWAGAFRVGGQGGIAPPAGDVFISALEAYMRERGLNGFASEWCRYATRVMRSDESIFDIPIPGIGEAVLLSVLHRDLESLHSWQVSIAEHGAPPGSLEEAWLACSVAAALQVGWRTGFAGIPLLYRGTDASQDTTARHALAVSWGWSHDGPSPCPMNKLPPREPAPPESDIEEGLVP